MTIAVIDGQDVVLSGIRAWIAADPEARVEVVHAGTDLDDLNAGPGATADVLVIDPCMRGELVFERIAALSAQGRRIVVFSRHTEPDAIRRAELVGARAYIVKEAKGGRRRFIEAVLAAAADGACPPPGRAGAATAALRDARPSFSEQELRSMRLWLDGLTRVEVARRMGISEHTVKQYLDRAREKYARAGRDVSTRLELYREARRDGIVAD
ncbi:response regulator transcription factor [Actinomadura oligospora]|uniref:response regulator transcription factor n=1 Tax=Actinomadura oligospora TaxID=111804 RepID=UPI001472787F|nr:LuxR C-terminal-related transcriptional regulator [Actinomadura oligospora]